MNAMVATDWFDLIQAYEMPFISDSLLSSTGPAGLAAR
jgi:hypothetical protein